MDGQTRVPDGPAPRAAPDKPGATRGGATGDLVLAASATCAALAPFLGKPFHVDDPLFLWLARRVTTHPLDPFGFEVNWYGALEPMWSITQNPPLAGYLIAAAASVVGWSEAALHGVFLAASVVAIVATALLARRCGAPPLATALATLFTPAFLVSATTLMCDVPMLALWLVAMLLWMHGIERDSASLLAAASVVAALAVLTKYFAVALVPLLVLWTWRRVRRVDLRIGWLVLPLAVLLGWHLWTASAYGRGLVGGAIGYASGAPSPFGRVGSTAVGIAFVGGCLASWAGLLPLACTRRALAAFAGAAVLAALGVTGLEGIGEYRFPAVGWTRWAFVGEASLFAIGGVAVAILAASEWSRRRDADTELLLAWLLGTYFFAAVVNWTANARSVLPLLPPAAILLARRIAERASSAGTLRPRGLAPALVLAAGLSLAVAAADHRLAEAGRAGARAAVERAAGRKLWFEGHWGLQWYLEQAGAEAIDFAKSPIRPGDRIAVPSYNTNLRPLPEAVTRLLEVVALAPPARLTTIHEAVGAGFYAAIATGPLPFGAGAVPAEEIQVYEAVQP
ncbi:MAG: hypothetical protein RL698_1784 [Pseudomonadota bacterium]